MSAPRAERAYRVVDGWLNGTRSITVRRVANAPKLNHDERRATRLKAQRGSNTKRSRGKSQAQNHPPTVPPGPSSKTIDRILKEYA